VKPEAFGGGRKLALRWLHSYAVTMIAVRPSRSLASLAGFSFVCLLTFA
jgi:hypothetical protein